MTSKDPYGATGSGRANDAAGRKDDHLDDDAIDVLFALARARDVAPTDDFLAAVRHRALMMQAPPRGRARRGFLAFRGARLWLSAIAGPHRAWAGAGVLAACLVAGLALGFLAPPPVGDLPVFRAALGSNGNGGTVETGLPPLDDLMAEG